MCIVFYDSSKTGQNLIGIKAWILAICYWFKLHFRAEPGSLSNSLKNELHNTTWDATSKSKLNQIGIALDELALADKFYIFRLSKQQLKDIKQQKF